MNFTIVLVTIMSASSCYVLAQDAPGSAKQESKSEATQTAPQQHESDEHVYARKQYVSALKVVYDDMHNPAHWNDQTAYRNYPFDTLALKIKALAEGKWDSISERDPQWTSASDGLAQELLKAMGNRETEWLNKCFVRLQHANDCVKFYKETVDKKVSDLTTRESDMIKACKSIDSYPPPRGQ